MRYLGAGNDAALSASMARPSADPLLLAQVRAHLRGLPDIREERVRQLRGAIAVYNVAADEIAHKMIGRAIGDQLR